MEGLAGQYSSREAFARHGGGGGLGAAAITMTEWDAKSHQLGSSNSNSSTGSANGFSSPSFSLGEVGHSQHQQEYNANTNNKHHHQHNHQPHQTPLMRGSAGGNTNNSLSRSLSHGGGQGGISQHIHNHPSIVIDSNTVSRQHQLSSPMLPSDHHTQAGNNNLGDRGGNNTPGRPGMSVQDLKNMTAMRMAQQQQHSGPASPVSGTGNQQHHPIPGSLSSGGRTPTIVGNNANKNSTSVQSGIQIVPPRRRASPAHAGLVVSQQQHEGGGGRLSQQQQQQQQQLLRQQREQRDMRELRELREQQQATLASPLLRLSNSQGGGVSSGSGGGAGRPPQLLVTQTRGQDPGVLIMAEQQHPPQRGIHRGSSAPRLYASPPLEDSLLAHGLSVEELKEMTKLRLQHQQGGGGGNSGRSSPKASLSRPGSALSEGRGNAGGLVAHDRGDWRHLVVGDEHDVVPSAAGVVRRSTSGHLMQAAGMSRDASAGSNVGGRRFHSSGGVGTINVSRMEASLILEDRMRATQSEQAVTSPRILSQPSSPCFSQPASPTSSAGNSPGRSGGRGYQGAPPPGFASSGGDGVFVHHVVGSAGFSSVPGVVESGGGGGGGLPMHIVRPTRSASVGGLGGVSHRQHGAMSPHVPGGSGPAGRGSPALMLDGGSGGGGGMMPPMARATRARSFDGRGGSAYGGSASSSPALSSVVPIGSEGILSASSLSPPDGESRLYGGGGGNHPSYTTGNSGASRDGGQFMLQRARRSSYDERMTMTASQAAASRRGTSSPPLPHHAWRADGGGHHGGGASFSSRHHHAQHQHQHQHHPHQHQQHEQHQHQHQQQPQPRRPSSVHLGVGDGFERVRSLSTGAVTRQRPASIGPVSSAVGYECMSIPSIQAPPGPAGGGSGGGASSTFMDAISMECAEFALLTPKSSAIAARQQSTSAVKTWSPQNGGSERRTAEKTPNAPSSGDPIHLRGSGGASYPGSGLAVECQASSRGGSPAGSPEPSGADVDENGASSCSSGGGSRQSSVRAAFGSLDAAVGRGGGGGAEAGGAVGGGDGSLERSFPIGAEGNGGSEVQAQRYGRPVGTGSVAGGAFFGEDLPDCAGMSLEGEVEESTAGGNNNNNSESATTAADAMDSRSSVAKLPYLFGMDDDNNGMIGGSASSAPASFHQSGFHLDFLHDSSRQGRGESPAASSGAAGGDSSRSSPSLPLRAPSASSSARSMNGGASGGRGGGGGDESLAAALHNQLSF